MGHCFYWLWNFTFSLCMPFLKKFWWNSSEIPGEVLALKICHPPNPISGRNFLPLWHSRKGDSGSPLIPHYYFLGAVVALPLPTHLNRQKITYPLPLLSLPLKWRTGSPLFGFPDSSLSIRLLFLRAAHLRDPAAGSLHPLSHGDRGSHFSPDPEWFRHHDMAPAYALAFTMCVCSSISGQDDIIKYIWDQSLN